MSAYTDDKLVHMANQIARNLALDEDPVGAVAAHIRAYWNPRMIDGLRRQSEAALEPVAAAAIAGLEPTHG